MLAARGTVRSGAVRRAMTPGRGPVARLATDATQPATGSRVNRDAPKVTTAAATPASNGTVNNPKVAGGAAGGAVPPTAPKMAPPAKKSGGGGGLLLTGVVLGGAAAGAVYSVREDPNGFVAQQLKQYVPAVHKVIEQAVAAPKKTPSPKAAKAPAHETTFSKAEVEKAVKAVQEVQAKQAAAEQEQEPEPAAEPEPEAAPATPAPVEVEPTPVPAAAAPEPTPEQAAADAKVDAALGETAEEAANAAALGITDSDAAPDTQVTKDVAEAVLDATHAAASAVAHAAESAQAHVADAAAAAPAAADQAVKDIDKRLAELSSEISSQIAAARQASAGMSDSAIVKMLREDLVANVGRDIGSLDVDGLRDRVLRLTTELRDRGKWEALRMDEALKQQDAIWAQRMEEAMHSQLVQLQQHLDEVQETERRRADRLVADVRRKLEMEFDEEVAHSVDSQLRNALKREQERLQQVVEENERRRNKIVAALRARTAAMLEHAKARSAYEVAAARAQKQQLASMALFQAVNTTGRATNEVACLKVAAQGDAVIAAAIQSLPADVYGHGVPTVWKLQQRFERVYLAARRAAMTPRNGGIWGHVVGYATSFLVVARGDDALSATSAEAIQHLDRAHAALSVGKLDVALEELDKLDGNARVTVSDFVTAAKKRMITDQALTLIRAQVSSLGVSLY